MSNEYTKEEKELACTACPNAGDCDHDPKDVYPCICVGYLYGARRVLQAGYRKVDLNRPQIVCLCGSTRFSEAFIKAFLDETLAGKVVLTVGNDWRDTRQWQEIDPQKKVMLDELHKRKIDLADEILVLNVKGYIGESTRSEIDYAIAHDKPVRYLEDTKRQIQEG